MPSEHENSTRPRRAARSRWMLVAIPLALLLLVGVESLWTNWRRAEQPTAEAEWIWIRGSSRWSGPRAFYAVRDFDLGAVPDQATLSALGDEEYVLYLNGERVGSNRYTVGADPDRYEVAGLLRPGRNRLVAHLRSTYSYGGFLAVLRAAGSVDPLVVTDKEWRVSRRRIVPLSRPELDIERPEQAIVVARPPEGRWGPMTAGTPRPLHADVVLARPSLGAGAMLLPGGDWQRRNPKLKRRPHPVGERVTFDWQQSRTGFLTLKLVQREGAVGLVYLGIDLPDPLRQPPDATVITAPGQTNWADTVPRTFRYALIVGLDQVSDARIVRTDPAKLTPILAGQRDAGVFGLDAPRLRTAIENVVWGELESLASDAEGKS